MALTWRIAPKTSPVIPPSRRCRRALQQPSRGQAGDRGGEPARGERRTAGRHAGRGDRDHERRTAVSARSASGGPAGDEGAEPAGPRRGGGVAATTETRPVTSASTSAAAASGAPRHRGERGHLDEQRQHQRGHAHRADVGAAHDRQRVRGRPPAAEPVGGVGEPVEMQAAGRRRRSPRPRARRRAGAWRRIPPPEVRRRAATQAPVPPSQQAHPGQPQDRAGRRLVVELHRRPRRGWR